MRIDYQKLPYRDNVSCIVFQGDEGLLVQLNGWYKNFWKFPQGGMAINETEEDTARRELGEEIGTGNIRIVGQSKFTNEYDWDDKSIELAKNRWRGQNQRFIVAEYLGDKKDLTFQAEELQNHNWVKLIELQKYINHDVPMFTGYWNTIKKVLKEFDLV